MRINVISEVMKLYIPELHISSKYMRPTTNADHWNVFPIIVSPITLGSKRDHHKLIPYIGSVGNIDLGELKAIVSKSTEDTVDNDGWIQLTLIMYVKTDLITSYDPEVKYLRKKAIETFKLVSPDAYTYSDTLENSIDIVIDMINLADRILDEYNKFLSENKSYTEYDRSRIIPFLNELKDKYKLKYVAI